MLDATALATPMSASEADQSPVARLFDAHHERLYRLGRRLSRSADEAEDLVQETFLRAAGSRVPAGDSAEEAWLVRVLVNIARDRWRRQSVRARAATELGRASQTNGHEQAYVARLAVQAALGRLAPRRRAIVVLHEIEGVGVAAIARLLALSPITVRWHLSRARQELSAVLMPREPGRKS